MVIADEADAAATWERRDPAWHPPLSMMATDSDALAHTMARVTRHDRSKRFAFSDSHVTSRSSNREGMAGGALPLLCMLATMQQSRCMITVAAASVCERISQHRNLGRSFGKIFPPTA